MVVMANNKSVDMERVPFLTGDRDHDINELNRVISLGGNVDNFKRALRSYLSQNVISEPDIDPALRNLSVVVAKRVATLESYLKMPEYEVDAINIEAVKKAYIDGSLEIRPGYWTYWASGRQKSNYLNDPKEIGPIPHEVFQRWIEEENGYRLWMEAPDEPFLQMAAYTAFLPSNQNEHHFYHVLLRLPGANGNIIALPVLDDTGSSFLEIFDNDKLALGIFPALLQFHQPVTLITASVPVQRSVIVLEVQLLDRTNNPIGDWFNVWAVVVPGNPNRSRCSGMFVRKGFYTATAPNGQGLLHVAKKKNGIVAHLPII